MSSTTAGYLMVYQFFTSAGTLIQDMLPLLYLFFGLFAALFAIGVMWKALRGAFKKVTK